MNDLLNFARNGDGDAENELFQYLSARFELIAAQLIRDRMIAQDIVQDACVTVLKKYKSVTFSVGFEVWAVGVLKMTIRNYWQRRKSENKIIRLEQYSEIPEIVRNQESSYEFERKLQDCFRRILKVNPRFARVLNLIYQGFSTDEIADRLGLTKSNLYSILCRSREMLKKCLKTGKV